MSDSIGSVSQYASANGLRSHGHGGGYRQIKSDMGSLASALSSGDMSAAATAFAQLQKDAPALAKQSQNGSSSNPRAQAFSALSSAMQSGDASSAMSALTELASSMKGHSLGQVHTMAGASASYSPSANRADADSDGDGSVVA